MMDGGWFKQPHPARVRLIGIWVRPQVWCTLNDQCTQVKPATPYTLTEIDPLHGHIEHQSQV